MNGGDLALTYWVVAGPSISGSGYGLGGYGLYGYGYGLGTSYTPGTPITAMDWFLDNWGEILLACPVGGPIFTWSIDSGFGTGAIIPTAPIANAGMFVAMPEQQIMAWGSTDNGIQDPLLIEWSDAGDFTQWTPATTIGFPRGVKSSEVCKVQINATGLPTLICMYLNTLAIRSFGGLTK